MEYAGFLLAFVIVPTALLLASRSVRRSMGARRAAVGVALMIGAALTYTIPWDNYLISRGVWWYGDGVLFRIGYAPVEEYAFIALQPLLTAAWLYRADLDGVSQANPTAARVLGAVGCLAVAAGGAALLTVDGGLYMGAILAWAAPVLALQWAVGGGVLYRERRLLAVAVGVPTLYLCTADRLAIGRGIWTISSDHTTGLLIGGLPVEEATFFLVTNLMLVQGLILFHWLSERWDLLAPAERPTERGVETPG
jgi:lycopene cyclase domain-containing protein